MAKKKQEIEQVAQPTQGGLPALTPEETRDLLKTAIAGGGVEAIERIVALFERQQEKAAARAHHAAIGEFASAMGPIPKTRTAKITTRGGSDYAYTYAALDDIARAIKAPLHAAGLSYTWDSDIEGDCLTVTCTLRHIDGHAESARFPCPVTSGAGMSEQQKVASALTYGRRQSLVQVLGLTNCDQDIDGADPEASEPITEAQAADLELLIENVGADKAKVLLFAGAGTLSEVPSSRYAEIVRMLEAKGKR